MKSIEHYWYSKNLVSLLLLPIARLFIAMASVRRFFFRMGLFKQHVLPVPVIIVGNISVGGTGKTPITEWLVQLLRDNGFKPGIVSRGYGGKARIWPQQVRADSDPIMVGDEPVLLAQRCNCPVTVDPKRVRAARALLEFHNCDVIIADDGLQHYALGRDLEIVVVDGRRRFGNGRCLPAGPLRESIKRLETVDYIIVNSGVTLEREFMMSIHPRQLCQVNNPAKVISTERLTKVDTIHAVAGIGNPQQFFDTLKKMHFTVIEHAFPDHYDYSPADISFNDHLPVIMTEKDAVKCQRFAGDDIWFLSIDIEIDKRLNNLIIEQINRARAHKSAA